MSLAEQSQQWYPTSVQVTVLQARGLRIKGKNGTNDAYAIMQVAKDKFSTSVAEKSVAPVWKEEAAFDLPLFHPGNADRCTLQVSVMHRALMGPDKLLGQANVNLLELYDNKSRNKSEWFKLMGKTGKPDKDRGEVLLDIQFMKNNMTASMFDLSSMDKSRSRLGKLKDKLKGKKKDGMSDSASAIVPSVGQILTDSEGEEEADATPETKKKSKLKNLFAPKGLHRNISQSMSTLPTLPEKDSAISLSRSSGLNVESPEGKKKFKLFKHKRTGSTDSKVSQGTGSLGQGMSQSNLCINGSHVYTEDPETRVSRAGSTLSLNSSGHGSMEDLRRGTNRKISTTSTDLQTQESAVEEMRRRQEEQRKQEDEVRKRLEEEKRRQIEEEEREQLRREEMRMEEERKRIEREEERKRMEREEEKRRLEKMEEEKRRIEREEERKRIEREEEKMRLEKIEEESRRLKREEERKRMEREMEEQRRIKEEEMERQEEMIRIKREQEKLRQEEERKREEEERMREEEEKRIREERRRRMEEEEKARLEKERMIKQEETRKIEVERRRAEEEMEAEEKRKRTEKEEKERKEQERLKLEKERMELERKEKEEKEMRMEQERKKKAKEEEEKKRKADQERIRKEKDEMEKQKKEKEEMNVVDKRPEVKPRSARMNTAKKAEKTDTIGSEDIPSTNPFEESFLLDENSTGAQPETLSRSTKVSAVRPSSSVSGIFLSSLPNTKPFLDDPDANSDNVFSLEDGTERSEKKRRAPMPPQNETQVCKPDVSSKGPSKWGESEDCEEPDVSGLQREKRPAPLPPDVSKNTSEESTTSLEEESNPFMSAGVRTAKHNKGPAPAKPLFTSTSNDSSASVPESKNLTISKENWIEETLSTDKAFFTLNSCLEEQDESANKLLVSKQPVSKLESDNLPTKQSGQEDLNTCNSSNSQNTEDISLESHDVIMGSTKKKSRAPLPPSKLAMTDDQNSISLPHRQDQDRTFSINSDLSASGFYPSTLSSSSAHSQAPEMGHVKTEYAALKAEAGHGSENKSLPRARVSPIDAQPVSGQNCGGDPAFKSCRPHAVKPLSTIDNHSDFKDNLDNFTSAKIAEGVQVKMKAPEAKATGPYAQLTHEELVNLLEKQKDQLSHKDSKIMELEQYIDNLLVRVMEEHPTILMSLNSKKKFV